MKIKTSRFGEIEIDEKRVIEFPKGIPGFSNLKKYALLDYKGPVKWLHSVEDPDVAFIVTDPFPIFPDYSFDIGDEVEELLEIKKAEDIVILSIINTSDNGLTANLKAPIISNISSLKAAQVLLEDERYSFKTPLPALPKEERM